MKLEPLAEWLERQGFGKRGRDIFVHHMPESAKRGILMTIPVFGQETYPDLPSLRRSRFQVIVRGYDYKNGLEKAHEIQNALTWDERQETLNDEITIAHMFPRHDPIPFPSSKGDILEIAVTFDAAYFVCA